MAFLYLECCCTQHKCINSSFSRNEEEQGQKEEMTSKVSSAWHTQLQIRNY